jgi:N-methylhydantoinase A
VTRFRLGVDVGGTFTDFLIVSDDGRRLVHKTSTTPANPSEGVLQGIEGIAARLGLGAREFLGSVDAIVHGTTVATNAVLTRRGAQVGLLCTKGFRDMLTFRDGTREETYNNRLAPPEPLAARHLRIGIRGRMDFDGNELEELNEEDLREAAALFEREGVGAVAICFMHSPMNQAHERVASELLAELLPGVYQTVSADLITQLRYYDRTSTAVLNSYVGPVISSYLDALAKELAEAGFGGVLLIMQSNGGVASPEEVSREAARAVLSGPASGPAFGLAVVEPLGYQDCLTIDMGGTSFDASLVKDGKPLVVTDGVIDRWRVALPTIGIHTIGAGGGSIAQVRDRLLQVGPMSAGASPGPACYGRGGELPTVTDADLVLGYLNDGSFLEGRMSLDVDAARAAIEEHVAVPLGVDVEQAAAGIHNLANVNMSAGVREITVRRGHDPRDFPLVVAGGAGPVHATAIARELSIPLLVVPREASIFCAAGMLSADYKHDYVQAMKQRLGALDSDELEAIWRRLAERGTEVLEGEGLSRESVNVIPSLDLRYAGQWWELNVVCPPEMLSAPDLGEIADRFHALHEQLFGYKTVEMPVDVLAARLTAVGATPKPTAGAAAGGAGTLSDALVEERPMWSLEAEAFIDASVYDGARLSVGQTLPGPAIVELGTSTLVVHETYDLQVDSGGSYIVTARDAARRQGSDGRIGDAVR